MWFYLSGSSLFQHQAPGKCNDKKKQKKTTCKLVAWFQVYLIEYAFVGKGWLKKIYTFNLDFQVWAIEN